MDNSLILKLMITITMMTGLACVLLPLISRSLFQLLTVATFYLLSTILLALFYINNGAISAVFLSLGSFSIKLHLEFFGVIFLLLLASLWCVTVVYTWHYVSQSEARGNSINYKILMSFMALCIIMASCVALSANMITMFIFYELLTLCTIPLVFLGNFVSLGKYLRPLLYPALLLWLPAILYIHSELGSTDFVTAPAMGVSPTCGIILLLMCIFGISKSAPVPFHSWLPAAMIATHPVSAMLHSVAVVNTGLFCVFKIIVYIFGLDYLKSVVGEFSWLIIIPGIGVFYASYRAFTAKNLKQVLAYSTISQLNFCVIGALLLSKAGIIAAVMQMVSHSAAKIVLFFSAGAIYLTTGKQEVSEMRGLYYQMPYTIIAFSVAGLSLCGSPLLAGYYSKAYLYEAAAEEYLAVTVITLGSIATCLYIMKVVYLFFIKAEYKHRVVESRGLLMPVFATICSILGFPLVAYIVEKLLGFL